MVRTKSGLGLAILILISGVIILSPVIVNAEYAYRKAITIDHTKVSSTLTNFPVLVSISNDNDLKNHVTSVNGYDLVFKDGSSTKLDHELERWDGSTGTLVAWVKIPSLSSTTDTIIYMCYGDSGVTTSQENKTGVWDSSFKGVWHLPNGITLTANDSTSNGNNGTNYGVIATTGKIDGGGNFNGSGHYVDAGIMSAIQGSSSLTISMWIYQGSYQSSAYIYKNANSGILFQPWSDQRIYFAINGIDSRAVTNAGDAPLNSWFNLVGVYNGSNIIIFINGQQKATSPKTTTIPTDGAHLLIGNNPVTAAFVGLIDEVRISNVARSGGWILTEYRNQSSPSTFYTVGGETVNLDTTPPVVTAFVVPSVYSNLIVPITIFTATDNFGVTGYLVNESPSTPSLSGPNWSVTPQTQYAFSSGGNKTLYAWAKDAAGNISNSLSASVLVEDTVAPTITAFVIPTLYNNLTVPITTFTATDNFGVTGYLVNESPSTPSLSGPNWSATPQTQYIVSSEGSKTLYAWAKDAAGNISNRVSKTVSVVIGQRIYVYNELNRLIQVIYEDGSRVTYTYDASGNRIGMENQVIDTTPPTTTASPPGGTYAFGQTITLSCNDGSGSGCDKIYYTTDGTTPTTSSPIYSAPINISATTTLKFFAKDLAGNSEAVKTATYTIDTTPPTGTITINSGVAFTNNPSVILTLSCNDLNGCSQMQFSNDNITYSTPETYATTKAWILTTGDGTKTVYVKFKDTAGNWSLAYSNTILLDATFPTTSASPIGGTYNSAQSVTLACNDGTGSGCDKIYYTTDSTTPTTSSPVYSSPINISATTTLKFFAKDLAGNSEAVKSETYTISTNMVTVELKDSTGAPLSGGVVQYYSGGWQTFGTTDTSGRVSKELTPGTYTFSMNYAFGRQEKAQNTATNPTVVFQTIGVTVQLKDSTGALMDTGTVQYYSGGWRDIGSTSGGQVSKELLPGSYTFSMNYGFARQEKAQNIAADPTVVFQTINATIQLKDSTGALIDTGTVQYYSGGWHDIGITSGGQVSKELLPGSYTFSMNYGYARQEKAQNIATNPTVVFQTTRVTIELRDSTNSLMDSGTVQYYSGGWRDIGSTSGGQVSKELLPGSYTFSMNYGFARQEKAQNIAADPTVVFQTIGVTVQLKDSTGTLMDTGTVQYYSGGWRDIGSTSGGQVTKELLPGSYTFSMNYGFARQEKAQNVATNPTVVFQTINATIQLKDSTGTLMDSGTVQYYSGGWHDIGSTSGGQVSKELLPGSYTFSMNYGFARQEKAQNIASDPTVVFQTVGVTVQLKDSTGTLMDTGTVQYYSGGWRDIGSTSGGQASKELLPGSYTFSMNYAFARQEKAQNIASDPTVVFQTIGVTVQLKDSTGALIDTGTVQYYSGGWRDIGSTSGGQVSKELLPASYTFSMNYGFARQEKAQNIAADPTVVFQTGQVYSDSGSCTNYYAGGWRAFTQDMELLPLAYTFRFNDTTPDTSYTITTGTVNHIH